MKTSPILLSATLAVVSGFSVDRRQAIVQAAAGGFATAVAPGLVNILPANAVVDEETPRVVTRMGGLLVRSGSELFFVLNRKPGFPFDEGDEKTNINNCEIDDSHFFNMVQFRNPSKMVLVVSE
jgi:hypothetical protein